MLNFVTKELAAHYFLLAFLAILGVLQLVAARHRLIGLSLWGSRHPVPGYLLGTALTTGAFVWFFAATPLVFTPGLAGAELTVLFAAGGICALAFALIAASIIWEIKGQGAIAFPPSPSFDQESIAFQQVTGTLYVPSDNRIGAAICAVPDPLERAGSLQPLARRLAGEGFIVLTLDWPREGVRYPETLVPTAVAYLAQREEVDPQRIGALGFGLGGDLAIRAASADRQIKAVLALAPILSGDNVGSGLNILKEMCYLEALRRARHRRWKKLATDLGALESVRKIGSRPLLLVYGDEDAIIPPDRACGALSQQAAKLELKLLPGEGHLSLLGSAATAALAAGWFREVLCR